MENDKHDDLDNPLLRDAPFERKDELIQKFRDQLEVAEDTVRELQAYESRQNTSDGGSHALATVESAKQDMEAALRDAEEADAEAWEGLRETLEQRWSTLIEALDGVRRAGVGEAGNLYNFNPK